MVMYNPTIPVGEEKLALVRFLNVFNAFVARGDIVYSNEPGKPSVLFEMLAPDGVKFGVFQVRKLDESNPFRDLGHDAIFFYGEHEFFYEIDVDAVNRMRDGSYQPLIVEKDKVFGEFMEFVKDFYPEFGV